MTPAWLTWVLAWIAVSIAAGLYLAAAGYRRNSHRARKEES
ncbi:hypothetical protein [Streptomyces sp. UH6]|nr:hypothetical protein [Streptomyces sp. UH6]